MARFNTTGDTAVLEFITSQQAATRADISRHTGLAPSTVTGIVNRLLQSGVIVEEGTAQSTGGRPGSILSPITSPRRVLVAEFGAHHMRLGLADHRGEVTNCTRYTIDIAEGPTAILKDLITHGTQLAASTSTELIGYGIAIPGPVNAASGTVIGPSRMPGWNGSHIPTIVSQLSDLPVVVENDARIGASGEHAYRKHVGPHTFKDYIYVKAGSAIGGAFVHNGSAYCGSRGIAGDISHVPVEAGDSRPCQCGNTGCLDTVASANAVRAHLQRQGLPLATNSDLITAALDGQPEVVTVIRQAGVVLGQALARNVAFLAPEALIIGGTLSAIDAFSAGLRQVLHELCLPSIVDQLVIEHSLAGMDAALWGLADAALQSPHISFIGSSLRATTHSS